MFKTARDLIQSVLVSPDAVGDKLARSELVGAFFEKLVTATFIGVSCSMFYKLCRTKRRFLGSEDPKYVYMRNRESTATLHAFFSTTSLEVDVHHLNNDFLRYGFAPYAYIDRDDYRLGESEWNYRDIEAPSSMVASGGFQEVQSQETAELEFFMNNMEMLVGGFPLSDMNALFDECEIVNLEANEILYAVGDLDNFMYIVIKGKLQIVVVDEESRIQNLRMAQTGDRVLSLFSFVDVLTGNARPLKSVEAYALEDSCRVLKFPLSSFREYLMLNPVRIPDVMCRLIRKIYDCNFVMLHRILGLPLDSLTGASSVSSSQTSIVINWDNPENIPSPEDDPPEWLRSEAISAFKEYLHVPQDADMDDCMVFIFDPDPRPDVVNKHPIIDNENIKFKFLYKGQAEIFRIGFEKTDEERKGLRETLYILNAGEVVGGLSTFAEVDNFIFFRVLQRSVIVATTQHMNSRIYQNYPNAVLPIANQIIRRLSPVMRKMDFGVEWTIVRGGQALFLTGSEVRDTFVVLAGKLRSYMIDMRGRLTYYGEYERSDWVGLVEAMVQNPIRSKTVIAVRDTEVYKVPIDFIQFVKTSFPVAARRLLGYMANREGKSRTFACSKHSISPEYDLVAGTSRRCTSIAIIPTSDDDPYIVFAKEIKLHHDIYSPTAVISWKNVQEEFNFDAGMSDHHQNYLIETWILSKLANNDLVVFVCSYSNMRWSDLCFRHSEVIITLGRQDNPMTPTILEKRMIETKTADGKRKELVIIHAEEIGAREGRYKLPRDTIAWLEKRPWINFHHHIRIPEDAFLFPGLLSNQEIDINYKPLSRNIDKHSDLSRYCRWLMGKSVGVIFTGGGARFAAQAGALKAIKEHDIPIDLVGGVGTGFLLAALYVLHEDIDLVIKHTELLFSGIGEANSSILDMTIPWISPRQGRLLISLVMKFFGRTRLEDTFIPVFCLTCDISKQDYRVHRDGPFWIYARASLANFINGPPVNDPKDGGYIVDGTFANPVPEDIMRKFGAEYVLVINTNDGRTFDPPNIPFNLWHTVLQTISRLSPKIPDFVRINDMINRTQKMMYSEAVEANIAGLYVAFIKPNSENYSSQLYQHFNRLLQLGYAYAERILNKAPLRGIAFHEFWRKVQFSSAEFEQKQGRGLRYDVKQDYWEQFDLRLFQRDVDDQKKKLAEMKVPYGSYTGRYSNKEQIKIARQQKRLMHAFRDEIFSETPTALKEEESSDDF